MFHTEQQYKMLEQQIQKLKKENELKEKEVKLLKKQNKEKDEVIYDLDKYNYRGQCQSLKIEIAELKKKVNAYEELLGIANISLNKDSSNSCKPSSTNGFKVVVQNNRVKSGRKPGREKGHKKSSPTVSSTPDSVKSVSKVATCTCGCKTEEREEIKRDLVSIEVITHITQYVGRKTECPCCHKKYMPKFPKGINNPVNYDENIKASVVYLNAYCNVPNEKCSNLLGFLTDGKLKIAPSTVPNIMKQFSNCSKDLRETIKKQILKEPVIYEDETPTKIDGKIGSTIGVFTDKLSIEEAFENRKLESFEEMGILNKYIGGTVCHDHNNIHRAFKKSKDAECNFHILRYCKAEYEIHHYESIRELMNYLLGLRDTVDEYKLHGKNKFEEFEYKQAKEEYLRLLDNWDKEYEEKADKNKPKYYRKMINLKTRLKEFADDHLRFLTDFRIDFTNNLAERRIEAYKEKIKDSRNI